MINFRRELKKIPLVRKFLQRISKRTEAPNRDITEMRMALVRMNHPELRQECDYILHNLNIPDEWFIPYPILKSFERIVSGYDRKLGLPFVVYEDKRLYFPSSYSEELCASIFKGFMEKECLLGGVYREKQPHQYESDQCKVESGNTLVDVGCAEGLFTLGHIEQIEKAYLIEGNANWIPALKATFSDFMDKVVIINKYVSNYDSDKTITLNTILPDKGDKQIFVKMDIEGGEKEVLFGNMDYLKSLSNVKMAVCTYHRQDDADLFAKLFNELGFQYEFSDGYMYIHRSDFIPFYPYFRHGVIRAWKN